MERITSRRNRVVEQFRAAAVHADDRVLLDGAHLLREALTAGLDIDVVAIGERVAGRESETLAERASRQAARIVLVTDAVLNAISPVRQPSGLVAIARHRPVSLDAVLRAPAPLVLVLVNVQDPGNVGAVVRAAEACGATGVVTTRGTADPFQWKALRGSMGSSFRLPVAAREPLPDVIAGVRRRGVRLVATVPRNGTPLPRCDFRAPVAIVLGSEGHGLPAEVIEAADERLAIPMRPPVDSLNVATAAALVAYEAHRQREETPHDHVALRE